MALSYRSVKQRVTRSLTREILEQVIEYVELADPKLVGMQQGDDFVKEMVLLTIYKDLTGVGSGALKVLMGNNVTITQRSLLTNTKRIREQLYEWAVSHIDIGTADEWNDIAASVKRPKDLESVNLWLDSTDFKLARRNGRTKSSMYWSYKLNGPGWRFMILQDGNTRIRWMRGGYSPKIYDGNFLMFFKQDIEEQWKGGFVICDQHFTMGERHFTDPKFLAHYTTEIPKGAGTTNSAGEELATLTKKQKTKNKERAQLRARVESPFGWIKESFKSLNQPWMDTIEQLEYAIYFACAVHSQRHKAATK